MKRTATVIGIVILVGALAIPVFAHGRFGGGRGWSGGPGSCWQGETAYEALSEDQRNELSKLDETFFNETAELRREIWVKSDELNVFLNTADPDPVKAKALNKELSDLKAKMSEQRLDYELKARKVVPKGEFARGYGRGHGRHMKGHGPGWGGGYGPGSCWNQ